MLGVTMRWLRLVWVCAALVLSPAVAQADVRTVTPVGQISEQDKGTFVTVQGEITAARSFSRGVRYTLRDESGAITLVLFERALKQLLDPQSLREGAVVRATGKVDFYRKQKQIVPVRGTDVTVVAAAQSLAVTPLGEIGVDDDEKRVRVVGEVIDAWPFASGFKFALRDTSGEITLTIFEQEYDALRMPEAINVGAILTVTGRVNVFRNKPELILSSSANVEVAQPARREVRQYALGPLSGNDHNAVVRVVGRVYRVDPLEDGGRNVLLYDETGVQIVHLPPTVAKRVTLVEGDAAAVIGRVRAVRRRGITIEVSLPSDVIKQPAASEQ